MPEESIDPLLEAISRLAEHGYTLTATFIAGGVVVAGRVVSERRYLKGIRQQFNAQVHQENMPGLEEILTLFQEASEVGGAGYIHLEEARVLDGSPAMTLARGYWRIRLAEVSGFRFGA